MAGPTYRAASGLLLAIALTSCGSEPTVQLEGSYSLDHDAFVDEAVQAMSRAGLIPEGVEEMARGRLGQLRMDLQLDPAGTFACQMTAAGQSYLYTGGWVLVGSHVRLEQTHQDGSPVPDVMKGTYRGGVLRLLHEENGMEMPYVLRKAPSPAAPR